MRKIVSGLFLSLDGVYEAPDQWHFPYWSDVMAELRTLKEQPGKNIAMIGSGALVASLVREGLLDELRLLVHPILVGKGKRLFANEDEPRGLQLADSKNLPNGVLYLTYRPAAK